MHTSGANILSHSRGVERPSLRASACLLASAMTIVFLALPVCSCKNRTAAIGFFRAGNNSVLNVAEGDVKGWKDSAGVEVNFVEIKYDLRAAGSPDEDVTVAEWLIKVPDLVGVVGHDDSRGSLLTAPIYNEAGIPHIIPTSTSRRLKQSGPWTFTLAPDEVDEGAFIGSFVADRLRARTVTVFYQADEYGTGLRDGVASKLAERGIKVIDQVSFDWMHNYPQSQDKEIFSSITAASLRRGVPDVVVIAGRNREAGQIARLIHERASEVIFVAGDGVQAGAPFFSTARSSAELFYFASFWNPEIADETSQAFVERFRRITGRAPLPSDAMKYDAAMLLAEAVRQAGANREAVRRYLADLGVNRPAWRGVTGEISFAPDRPARLVMMRIRGGAAVHVSSNGGN